MLSADVQGDECADHDVVEGRWQRGAFVVPKRVPDDPCLGQLLANRPLARGRQALVLEREQVDLDAAPRQFAEVRDDLRADEAVRGHNRL